MKNILISGILAIFLSISCKKTEDKLEPTLSSSHIEYFGFTLIDTYWDDPTDSEVKTNYSDEVHSFSNIADILVVNPSDNIIERIDNMTQQNMQVVLHLNEIFFEAVGTNSLSGVDYDLRADYQSRWDEFVNTNQLITNQASIKTFYIGEEPTWNGISFEDLRAATDYVKHQFPNTPIMLIEAYPILANLQVPVSVDWVGFDHYFIKNPNTSMEFQDEWIALKSKLTSSNQKLVVIMDSHYINWAHGDFGNIALNEMKDVANNYYDFAKSDTSVIAILGYFWPNGFDTPESIGARGMPQSVKDEYIRIGKEITGKN